MRFLVWVVLAVAALWSGYWFVGSTAVERAAVTWFEQAASLGLTASNQGVRVAGYPNRFDLTVTAPDVSDPVSGFGWRGAQVQLLAMSWKPWHLIALMPDAQTITTPGGEIQVLSSRLRGSLIVHPGPDLNLDRIVIEGADLTVTTPTVPTPTAATPTAATKVKAVTFATTEDTSRQHSHRIGLRVTELTPNPALLPANSELDPTMSSLTVDAHLLLSAALDRHMATTRPQMTGLVLDALALEWGALRVTAAGSVAATSDGTAEGRVDFTVVNWRLLPDALAGLGAVQPELTPTLLRALEIMAEDSPDPTRLELPLVFKSGRMLLGPLPIGPAPLLVQRQ